jgi:3-methyladenine DNA glycosylase/8-oxoguanine DNA glycosylase
VGGAAAPAAVAGERNRTPARPDAPAVIERDVRPLGLWRMPGPARDGLLRRRSGGLVRLLHLNGEPVVVHAHIAGGAVRLRSQSGSRDAAAWGVDRMRFALCLDHDLSGFHRRFVRDPLIGPVIRWRPWIRPHRKPDPFEALAWAICEQLIETQRAWAIQRRLVWRYGRLSPCGSLRDAPSARTMAGRAPAELQACDLSAERSLALVKAAREVTAARTDLTEHEPVWARLRRIPGIGSWTLEKLAFHGQGRDDQLPAGDLAYVKLVGSLAGLGRRATEDEVRLFFEPYAPYTALAGLYALSAGKLGGRTRGARPVL